MCTPVRFERSLVMPADPAAIVEAILDVSQWTTFGGYGPLPGIAEATRTDPPPGLVGTRVAVRNTDGSTHTEVIRAYEEGERLELEMGSFSPPLCRIATRFIETWRFERVEGGTRVVRSFALFPRRWWGRPLLWCIGRLLGAAIGRHLRVMAAALV